MKELRADMKELKQTVGSISETVGAMAQRDALLLVSGAQPPLRVKGAVVHTLGELLTLLGVTDAAAVRRAVEAQCAAVLRTPAPLVHAVLAALCARVRLTMAQLEAALEALLMRDARLLEEAEAAAFPPGVAPGAGGACDWRAVESAAECALVFFSAAQACAPEWELGAPLRQASGLRNLAARMGDHATLPASAAASLADEDLRGGTLAFGLFTALHMGAPLYALEFDGVSTDVAASTLRVELMESKIGAQKGAYTRCVLRFG
jgi:hypothetical protein